MENHKYTTTFSSEIRPLVSAEKDKYLAMASLVNIGDFIPDIDSENIDLLPVAFNAFVANRVNKNGDVISGSKAIEISNSFINKPINVEHNRGRVVGVILAAGYSEFGTDHPLDEEKVKEMSGPFNVTLGGVIWKVVSNELSDLIEESNDPTSEFYQKISASWELGFSEFQLAAINGPEKNLEDADIISDAAEISEKEKDLKTFGGTGVLEDGRAIYRLVVGNVVPLGIGLTENPAADVAGIAIKSLDKTENTANNIKDAENKSSQTNQINVKKDVETMKIENLKDITDESLKTLEASTISDFIHDELKKASEEYSEKIHEKEEAIKTVQAEHDQLKEAHEEASKTLETVKEELETIKVEQAAREAEDTFNRRMAQMDEKYELTDEYRKVLASDLKDLDEENFSAYQEKMTVLLRSLDKKVLAEEKTKAEAEVTKEETVVEEVKASEEDQEAVDVVEEVLESAEVDAQELPTSIEAEEPTVYDKYKQAFGLDQFEINIK